MFCFGVRVKDSPNFKIYILCWVSGTFGKFKIFVDYGCVIGGSSDSRFFGNYSEFNGFHYSPTHNINFKKFHSCLDRIKNKELKTCFQKKKVLLFIIQPPNFRKLLITAKY